MDQQSTFYYADPTVKDPAYFDQLSSVSVHTLSLQGDPTSADEVAAFDESP